MVRPCPDLPASDPVAAGQDAARVGGGCQPDAPRGPTRNGWTDCWAAAEGTGSAVPPHETTAPD
ncbi:hypothetical protein GCM10020254_06460 [Streptomyces goshikiensis]